MSRWFADYPDIYKLIAGDGDYREYEMPKKYVSFSKPRKLTAEQISVLHMAVKFQFV